MIVAFFPAACEARRRYGQAIASMSTASFSSAPRLEMGGIGKSFGGVAVLSNVDLTVAPGEVVALLGSNGAGKSTLVKILTGVYARDAGEVRIDGEAVRFKDARAALAAGVRLLPQEISVMPDMTVAENISHRRSAAEARPWLSRRR